MMPPGADMRVRVFFLLLYALSVASAAHAQAAIAGTVVDVSGGVLPGVTVEVTSDALIEKSRPGLTNGSGRYRIEDLPPGRYTITFRRDGWSRYERAGVDLTGSFTAIVDATLALGSLSDTVSVRADSPLIDVRTAKREVTLTGDLVKTLPTVRSYNALLVLMPGIVTNASDTVTGTATTSFPIHGGRTNEGRMQVDGLNVGSPPSGNSATSYVIDAGNAREVSFVTSGALGESETGGVVMNIVSKSGGNTYRGSFLASGMGSRMQSSNLTPELEAQGVTAATPLSNVYDAWVTFGGAIEKDRAWFFVNGHTGGFKREVTSVFYNHNAGDASKWLYSPDLARPEYSDRTFENASGRVTWQVTPRNKVTGFWDAQSLCRSCTGSTPGLSEPQRISPEAVGVLGRRLDVAQATWSSPINHRWLLDAGFGATYFGVGNFEREPNPTRSLIRVAEQCASGCAANGNIAGLVYRSQDFSIAYTGSYLWRASVSFVSGSHSLKAGYQHALMTDDRTWFTNDRNLTYRFNNGVPNQLTQSISPWVNNTRVGWDGLFVQDQWTRHRLTLQGAARFDRASSWFPAQPEGPSRFLPAPILIPETRGVDSYNDVTLRIGAAYDAFGNGKTAIRATLGKYLEGAGANGNYANANPSLRMPQTTPTLGTAGVTRAWDDANQNREPDCDLSNPAAQDLRPTGGDMCGVMSNTSFGRNVLTNDFDPAVLRGWGVRPSDWNVSLSLQQQIAPRVSVDVAYFRRSYHGFFVADNLAVQSSDLTPFSIVAPQDPRLPDGGGYVVSGLLDVVPEKAGQVSNLVADAGRYGTWEQYFNGVDVTLNVRDVKHLTFIGGISTGQTVADNCAVRAALPELATTTTGTSTFGAGLATSAVTPASPYCRAAYGFLTQGRGLIAYVIPKADVQVAATFQSKPGPMLAANYAATNADVAPSLGRNLSGGAANVTINLIEPGALYGDRINQLDLRIARPFSFKRTRTKVSVDLYNVLNSSAALAYNNTFVPNGPWLQPQTILTPRFVRLSAEIDF